MSSKGPSAVRVYHTNFSFESMLDALEREGIRFKEGVKGRIFFRIPEFSQTLIEFCRGGKLMLKGHDVLRQDFGLQDDYIMAELTKIQDRHFRTLVNCYKLSSVNASKAWLRSALAYWMDNIMPEGFKLNHKFADSIGRNLWLLANENEELMESDREREKIEFKIRQVKRFFELLLTGERDTEFTPLSFDEIWLMDTGEMAAILNPEQHFTRQGGLHITYFLNLSCAREIR
jgi:hypothetical protein